MSKTRKKSKNLFGIKLVKRKRRRRKKNDYKGFLFSLLGFFMLMFLGGLGANYLASNSNDAVVQISGIENTSIEKDLEEAMKGISSISYSFLGKEIKIDNFFLSERKKIDILMEKFPQLERVSFKKADNGDIVMRVVEKQPAVAWCDEECSVYGSDNSYLGSYDEEEHGSLPIIKNQGWNKGSDYRGNVIENVSVIKGVLTDIAFFRNQKYYAHSDKLVLVGDTSCEFIFDPKENMEIQIEKLKTVLSQDNFFSQLPEVNYIDFRFKNQVIIK